MGNDAIRVPATNCLECGRRIDAVGSVDGKETRRPTPGDPIACLYCGAVATISERGKIVAFNDDQIRELLADPEIMRQLSIAVRKIHFVKHGTN